MYSSWHNATSLLSVAQRHIADFLTGVCQPATAKIVTVATAYVAEAVV